MKSFFASASVSASASASAESAPAPAPAPPTPEPAPAPAAAAAPEPASEPTSELTSEPASEPTFAHDPSPAPGHAPDPASAPAPAPSPAAPSATPAPAAAPAYCCFGFRPPELSNFLTQYPFAQHGVCNLAWSFGPTGLFMCGGQGLVGAAAGTCAQCQSLEHNTALGEIVTRVTKPGTHAGLHDGYVTHEIWATRRDQLHQSKDEVWKRSQNALRKVSGIRLSDLADFDFPTWRILTFRLGGFF